MSLHNYNQYTNAHGYPLGIENTNLLNPQSQSFTKAQYCQYIQDALCRLSVTSDPDQFQRLTEDMFQKMDRLPFAENEMVRNLNYIRSFKVDFKKVAAKLEKNGKLEPKKLFPKPASYQKNIAGQQYLDTVKKTFVQFIQYSLLPA